MSICMSHTKSSNPTQAAAMSAEERCWTAYAISRTSRTLEGIQNGVGEEIDAYSCSSSLVTASSSALATISDRNLVCTAFLVRKDGGSCASGSLVTMST